MTILDFMNLFAEFRAASWDGWRAILARLTPTVREFYAFCGRGSGKSRTAALLACFFASREYPRVLGEFIYIGIFGPDRKQAAITFRYVQGLMRSVPSLAALIVAERADSIELSTGIIVEVITASVAAPRGRSYALVIIEEAAFLPTDQSANPDIELIRGVRPALARVLGSLLAVVSSTYACRGVPWMAWQKYHKHAPADIVFVQAPTLDLNPTFDRRAIETAYEEDPAAAAAEYGAEFRRDVEGFVSREAVDAVVIPGRLELPTMPGELAFVDVAGGSGTDSSTLATARRDGERAVLCLLREIRPPFSPEAMVEEFAATLKARHIDRVVGDKYAGEWPAEQFQRHGLRYEAASLPKSDLYRELLPALNSRRVELLDHPRLIAQLLGLERRTSRGGRDTIDHGPSASSHDDVINAAAGALLQCRRPPQRVRAILGTW